MPFARNAAMIDKTQKAKLKDRLRLKYKINISLDWTQQKLKPKSCACWTPGSSVRLSVAFLSYNHCSV